MFSEDLKILLIKKKSNFTMLASAINTSVQNLTQKTNRNTIKASEYKNMLEALGVDCELVYKDKTTKEIIYISKI